MIPTPCVAPISYAFPCFSLLPGPAVLAHGDLDVEERALAMDKEDLCLNLGSVIKHTSLRDLFCTISIIFLHLFIS